MIGQTMLSPKDFAVICCKTHEIREASFDDKLNGGYGKYLKDYNQAAQEACESLGYNLQWARIISVLLFPGYCDVWDWCTEVCGKEKP